MLYMSHHLNVNAGQLSIWASNEAFGLWYIYYPIAMNARKSKAQAYCTDAQSRLILR